MEHVYRQRGEEGAEDELILLFPCQKGLGKTNWLFQWQKHHCAEKDILSSHQQRRRHLNQSNMASSACAKKIIGVGKLKVDYMLCVRRWDDDCFCGRNWCSSHGCIVGRDKCIKEEVGEEELSLFMAVATAEGSIISKLLLEK